MKPKRMFTVAVLVFAVAVAAFTASHLESEKEKTGVLRHVVAFKFKEDASKEKVDEVIHAFANLKNEIPQITDFEWGENNSPEGLDQGFTHCFILTFKSAKDRDDYLPHPAHKAFGKQLGPVLEKVFVIDYSAK